jgi:F-type H+-transporting ATPase subunit epsilon
VKLIVTTPIGVVAEVEDALQVRAEDSTGAFGIRPGHADFITALAISVLTWRDRQGEDHHIAVRGGVLTVQDGDLVEVATREAVGEKSLRELGPAVLERFREEQSEQQEASISATRLHLAVIRQLQRYLDSGRAAMPKGGPAGSVMPGGEGDLAGGGGE